MMIQEKHYKFSERQKKHTRSDFPLHHRAAVRQENIFFCIAAKFSALKPYFLTTIGSPLLFRQSQPFIKSVIHITKLPELSRLEVVNVKENFANCIIAVIVL